MNFTHKLAHERPTLWPIPNIHPQCLSSLEPMLSEAQIPQSIRFQSSIGPPNPPQNSHNSIKILPPIPTNSTFHPTFFPLQGTPPFKISKALGRHRFQHRLRPSGRELGPLLHHEAAALLPRLRVRQHEVLGRADAQVLPGPSGISGSTRNPLVKAGGC